MRIPFLALAALLAAIPAHAQDASINYRVEVSRDKVLAAFRERGGKRALHVTVPFKIRNLNSDRVAVDVPGDEIVVTEDGQRVAGLEIFQPRTQALTPILALDISGSMASSGKIKEARIAASAFLDRLDERSDGGLILFDHLIRQHVPPVREPAKFMEHRDRMRRLINEAKPLGGTAYLDAASEAIQMLRGIPGRKAVVVLTDGVDMSSAKTLAQVIAEAQSAEVPVYTLGVGDPGKNHPVTTVLTLDHSGSMREPARDGDPTSKMQALHVAASRFIDLMRPNARTTLLPFSGTVGKPEPFSTNKDALKKAINALRPASGTHLYDATFAAVETLVAGQPEGKKAVVVLTDGMDTASRYSDRAVIARAKETGVPLHMLGLGRKRELNEEVMERMGRETGGSYHHAIDKDSLFQIFEKLAIDLHDDGIDEESLRRLAEETGGKYYPARDVTKLPLLYEELAEELQTTYTVTFPSRRSSHDGTARGIEISVVRGGVRVSDVASASYATRGLVVPEMSDRLYLTLLAILGVLLVIPAGLRGAWRTVRGVG